MKTSSEIFTCRPTEAAHALGPAVQTTAVVPAAAAGPAAAAVVPESGGFRRHSVGCLARVKTTLPHYRHYWHLSRDCHSGRSVAVVWAEGWLAWTVAKSSGK